MQLFSALILTQNDEKLDVLQSFFSADEESICSSSFYSSDVNSILLLIQYFQKHKTFQTNIFLEIFKLSSGKW